MKFFSWITAIIIIVIFGICSSLILGYINAYFGLRYGMILTGLFPMIIIFYFIAWVLMWNAGKADSPFDITKLFSK